MGYFNWATRWFVGKAAQVKVKGEANAAVARADTAHGAESAKTNTKVAAHTVENTGEAVKQSTANTAKLAGEQTVNAATTPVTVLSDKTKAHRPKPSHHESVDKIKQVFHIKDKHSASKPLPEV